MSLKVKEIMNYVYILIIIGMVFFLYNRYQQKQDLIYNNDDNYTDIQRYLLRETNSLDKAKKPILWIHIPHEYNARNWISFGSRSSFELNQPYLYLTVKSIIQQCEDSFHICLIDDNSFAKLLPNWTIQLNTVGDPVSKYLRYLALTQLLYRYGGMIVPISFLCLRDLSGLYDMGTSGEKLFVAELVDRNITSTTNDFYPSIRFMGAPKECPIVKDLIDFMQRTISSDYTSQLEFLGEFDRWCNARRQQINIIPGKLIGTKTMDDEPVLIDNLLSNEYINLYSQVYGIYIPAREILRRRHYEWFARLSPRQVLEANAILSKYILLANIPDFKKGTIESMANQSFTTQNWIGYWQVPSGFPLWGMKPPSFATHMIRKNTDPKP